MKKKANKKRIFWICVLSVVLIVAACFLYIYIHGMVEKSIYRLDYKETIFKYAQEYDLDPYLVASVIWAESSYDPEAVSKVGAVGLMQLMPDTAEWISHKVDMDDFAEQDLTDPDVNIHLGCWYLSYLAKRFDGNLANIIAGYNAGPNKVEEWLGSDEYSKDGVTLENIPYEETDNYVDKVQDAYEKYRELYEEND